MTLSEDGRLGVGLASYSDSMLTVAGGWFTLEYDGNFSKQNFISYNDSDVGGSFVSQKARGSKSSPSAVQSSDVLISFGGEGWATGGFVGTNSGAIQVKASENYSSADNRGADILFQTTPNGSPASARTNRLIIGNSGLVTVGSTTGTAQFTVRASSASVVGQEIKLAASQSANAFELNSSSGSGGDLACINKDGGLSAAKVAVGMGIGTTTPSHLLDLKGGAYSDGYGWYPASSREYKENVRALGTEEAMNTLEGLNPVRYNYKGDNEQGHVGFIAEDVPDLVALKDRKALSPMDIVAVLTKVLQEQQKTIDRLNEKMAELDLDREVKLENAHKCLISTPTNRQ